MNLTAKDPALAPENAVATPRTVVGWALVAAILENANSVVARC